MELFEQFEHIKFYLLGPYPRGEVGGLALNVILAFLSIAFSIFFGIILGYSRLSCRMYVKLPAMAFVEVIRSTPLIMLIFWFYFFLPYIFGEDITIINSAIISLVIYIFSLI